jgi:hypothetical protein
MLAPAPSKLNRAGGAVGRTAHAPSGSPGYASWARIHSTVSSVPKSSSAAAHHSAAAHRHASRCHGHPCARAQSSASRWPFLAAASQVASSHGQPCWRAHCSTSRWPHAAARLDVHASPPGAALPARPLQQLQVAAFSCQPACSIIPWAALLARPLQRAELPTPGCSPGDLHRLRRPTLLNRARAAPKEPNPNLLGYVAMLTDGGAGEIDLPVVVQGDRQCQGWQAAAATLGVLGACAWGVCVGGGAPVGGGGSRPPGLWASAAGRRPRAAPRGRGARGAGAMCGGGGGGDGRRGAAGACGGAARRHGRGGATARAVARARHAQAGTARWRGWAAAPRPVETIGQTAVNAVPRAAIRPLAPDGSAGAPASVGAAPRIYGLIGRWMVHSRRGRGRAPAGARAGRGLPARAPAAAAATACGTRRLWQAQAGAGGRRRAQAGAGGRRRAQQEGRACALGLESQGVARGGRGPVGGLRGGLGAEGAWCARFGAARVLSGSAGWGRARARARAGAAGAYGVGQGPGGRACRKACGWGLAGRGSRGELYETGKARAPQGAGRSGRRQGGLRGHTFTAVLPAGRPGRGGRVRWCERKADGASAAGGGGWPGAGRLRAGPGVAGEGMLIWRAAPAGTCTAATARHGRGRRRTEGPTRVLVQGCWLRRAAAAEEAATGRRQAPRPLRRARLRARRGAGAAAGGSGSDGAGEGVSAAEAGLWRAGVIAAAGPRKVVQPSWERKQKVEKAGSTHARGRGKGSVREKKRRPLPEPGLAAGSIGEPQQPAGAAGARAAGAGGLLAPAFGGPSGSGADARGVAAALGASGAGPRGRGEAG